MIRIQLRRAKGWRLPPYTASVARPTKWGNQYRVGQPVEGQVVMVNGEMVPFRPTRAQAVAMYRHWLARKLLEDWTFLRPLRGDLACWCPLDGRPCHADVILEALAYPRGVIRWAQLQLDTMPILPVEGERLTFGVHRQTEPDAETAPAWSPRTEADAIARFNREQRAFAKSVRS